MRRLAAWSIVAVLALPSVAWLTLTVPLALAWRLALRIGGGGGGLSGRGDRRGRS